MELNEYDTGGAVNGSAPETYAFGLETIDALVFVDAQRDDSVEARLMRHEAAMVPTVVVHDSRPQAREQRDYKPWTPEGAEPLATSEYAPDVRVHRSGVLRRALFALIPVIVVSAAVTYVVMLYQH